MSICTSGSVRAPDASVQAQRRVGFTSGLVALGHQRVGQRDLRNATHIRARAGMNLGGAGNGARDDAAYEVKRCQQ
jgi:hypothetical protein